MPLILDDASLEPWLDPDLTDRETIRQGVHHLDAKQLTHCPVSTRVNRPKKAVSSFKRNAIEGCPDQRPTS